MFVDINLAGQKYRIISVYLPHTDYSKEVFENELENIRKVVMEARNQSLICPLGEDFNSELHN